MSGRLNILKTDNPWIVHLRYRYNKKFKNWCKQFPGVSWNSDVKAWSFPGDMVPMLLQEASKHGYKQVFSNYELPWPDGISQPPDEEKINGLKPYPFQAIDIARVQDYDRFMLLYEMGLGKTVVATRAMRRAGAGRVLVIGPKIAGSVWRHETEKWWPGRNIHWIEQPNVKKRWRVGEETSFITFRLLERAQEELELPQFDEIWIDEIHNYQNPLADQTQAFRKFMKTQNHARVRGMTGTLMTNDPSTMWNPLNMFWPGRFGQKKHFKWRYMNHEATDRGYLFHGANKDTAQELRERLLVTGSRVTANAVAHLLPKLVGPLLLEIQPGTSRSEAVAWCLETLEQGHKHIAIHTWRVRSAHEIGDSLRKAGVHVQVITGSDAKRADKIHTAAISEICVLVSTIDSTAEAIDLTFNTKVLYAEMVDKLGRITQHVKRYHRLSGEHNVTMYWLQHGRRDQKMLRMAKKIKAFVAILGAGAGEGQINNTLKDLEESTKLSKKELLELAVMAGASFSGDTSYSEVWGEGDD